MGEAEELRVSGGIGGGRGNGNQESHEVETEGSNEILQVERREGNRTLVDVGDVRRRRRRLFWCRKIRRVKDERGRREWAK